MFERDKDVEIEELSNGDVKLNNIQNVKINNPKEAATFIEKCVIILSLKYYICF